MRNMILIPVAALALLGLAVETTSGHVAAAAYADGAAGSGGGGDGDSADHGSNGNVLTIKDDPVQQEDEHSDIPHTTQASEDVADGLGL